MVNLGSGCSSLGRMNQTMEKLKKMEEKEYPILMRVLFGLDTPTPVSRDLDDLSGDIEGLDFFDPTLNESQRHAIKFVVASREVALIHGPPGVSFSQRSANVTNV